MKGRGNRRNRVGLGPGRGRGNRVSERGKGNRGGRGLSSFEPRLRAPQMLAKRAAVQMIGAIAGKLARLFVNDGVVLCAVVLGKRLGDECHFVARPFLNAHAPPNRGLRW